jgi:hypothetical protein
MCRRLGSEARVDVKVDREAVFKPSDDLVSREIDGQLILVPIAAGIGDMEDELYTLNDTGRALWDRLDGSRTVDQIVDDLARRYDAAREEIAADVEGLIAELLARRMVHAV